MLNRKHLAFITGPQRSGTTFLLVLFKMLNYDIGFSESRALKLQKHNWHHGGLEYLQQDHQDLNNLPEVIKQPWAMFERTPMFYLEKFEIYPKSS